jgi:polygalacturonase
VIDNHFYSGHGMSIGSETFTGDSFLLVDGLVEDHTTSGIRIKSNVTRGDQFFDPGFKGDRIPDYKAIHLVNVWDETPGDVLIAGYDEAHRTEVSLDNVFIRAIKPDQVHLAFADITTLHAGDQGTNIDLSQGKSVKVTEGAKPKVLVDRIDPCSKAFAPMR